MGRRGDQQHQAGHTAFTVYYAFAIKNRFVKLVWHSTSVPYAALLSRKWRSAMQRYADAAQAPMVEKKRKKTPVDRQCSDRQIPHAQPYGIRSSLSA